MECDWADCKVSAHQWVHRCQLLVYLTAIESIPGAWKRNCRRGISSIAAAATLVGGNDGELKWMECDARWQSRPTAPLLPLPPFSSSCQIQKKKGRSRMEISKWKIKETETETERKRWKKKRRRFPRLGFVDGRWFPDESRTLRASTASLWQPSSPDGWAGFLSATEIDPENLTKSST